MLSAWYVVVRGSDPDLSTLGELCASSTEHSVAHEEDEWRLRSSTVTSTSDHEDAWPKLCELLVRLSDVAAAAAEGRIHLTPGTLGRTRPDGHSDVFVHPETIRIRARAFPPTIGVSGTTIEPQQVRLLRLQAANDHLRLALHFLNADLSWFNLWKAYEAIRDGNGGAKALIANGWTTDADVERVRKTANTYAAVGDDARHARLGDAAPPNPISLEGTEDYLRGLLSRWVESLT